MWVCLFRFGINCMAVCALNIHIQNCQPPERSESNYQFFRDISPPPQLSHSNGIDIGKRNSRRP